MERDRHLVRRQVLAAHGDEIVVGDGAGRDDVRDRYLAQAVVGHADHRRLRHAGDQPQHFLDVLGKDLVAAAVDDVARAALDPHEAVGVDAREVAGVDVAVGDRAADAAIPTAVVGGRTRSAPTVAARVGIGEPILIATPGCGRPTAPNFSGCSRASAAVQPITSPISACP